MAAAALFAGPLLLGLAVSSVGERSLLGAGVLLAEPALAGVGLYGVLALLFARRPGPALSLAAGLGLCGVLLHQPAEPVPIDAARPAWAEALRTCATQRAAVQGPVRVLTWRLQPDEPVPVEQIVAREPDVAVLHGVASQAGVSAIATGLGGDAKHVTGPDGGMAVIVRGTFQACGGQSDSWEFRLPDEGGRDARLLVTFPEVEGAGVFPLVAFALDRAGDGDRALRWPGRLLQGARQVGAVSRAIGPDRLVLVGDSRAPRSFRHLQGALLGAGLHNALTPPTWPHRLGSVPLIPVHAFDQVWAGTTWQLRSSQTGPGGAHPRRPLEAILEPTRRD